MLTLENVGSYSWVFTLYKWFRRCVGRWQHRLRPTSCSVNQARPLQEEVLNSLVWCFNLKQAAKFLAAYGFSHGFHFLESHFIRTDYCINLHRSACLLLWLVCFRVLVFCPLCWESKTFSWPCSSAFFWLISFALYKRFLSILKNKSIIFLARGLFLWNTKQMVIKASSRSASHLQSQSKLLGHFAVFLPFQIWCGRFGQLTAINNIGKTRRRARREKTVLGGRDCGYGAVILVFFFYLFATRLR